MIGVRHNKVAERCDAGGFCQPRWRYGAAKCQHCPRSLGAPAQRVGDIAGRAVSKGDSGCVPCV